MPRPRKSEFNPAEPKRKSRRAPARTDAPAANAEGPDSCKRRTKGSGRLFKRGAVWFLAWVVNGKKFCRSTKETTRRAAEKRAEEFIAPFRLKDNADADAGKADRAAAAGLDAAAAALRTSSDAKREAFNKLTALPLARAWSAFESSLFHKEWAENTRRLNEARVEAFAAWMKRHHPEARAARDVTGEHAVEFMQTIRAAHSGKTFNDYRAILLQTWDGLRKIPSAAVTVNPWRDIERAERNSHTRRELTVEELAAVIQAAEGEMRLLFAIGIYTGLRLGDAVRLDWGAVDLVRGFVNVTPAKTARHGTKVRIPLAPALRGILEMTPPRRRRGRILPALAAEYETEGSAGMILVRKVQAVFKAAGIETQAVTRQKNKDGTPRKTVEVGFHSLRHTYVSLCANAGVPLAIVQAIVGHTNPAMTAHYFHESDAALQGVLPALPDVTRPAAALPAPEPTDLPALPAPDAPAALPAPDAAPAFDAERFKAELEALTSAQLDEAARILAAVRAARVAAV